MSLDPETVALYWSKVVINPNGCWGWTGGTGCSDHRGIVRKQYAYRVSYEIHYGPIPAGLHICHKCDNPICSRPDHLFAGTQLDNMRDALAKGRMRGGNWDVTHCKRGHEFTPENTRLIVHASDGKPHRHCKACTDARSKEWYEAHHVPAEPPTHCRQGHPWDDENTRMSLTEPRHRICRACERRRKADWKTRKAAREQRREAA